MKYQNRTQFQKAVANVAEFMEAFGEDFIDGEVYVDDCPKEFYGALSQVEAALEQSKAVMSALHALSRSFRPEQMERGLVCLRRMRESMQPDTNKQDGKAGFAVDKKTRDEIRYRYQIGVPTRRLAQDFGLSRTTIRRYINTGA
jgi:hypothetical protein